MKLWNKEDVLNKKVEEFTVGDDRNSDMFLAKYDIIASIAHAKMLSETKIISKNESQLLIKELKSIKNKILKNEFRIEEQFEDIHSKLEFILTEKLGEVGKKIHTGRSRNDQVLVATQLYLKDEILIIKELIKNLFDISVPGSFELVNTMLSDGLKNQKAEQKVKVLDIAEIVEQASID